MKYNAKFSYIRYVCIALEVVLLKLHCETRSKVALIQANFELIATRNLGELGGGHSFARLQYIP